ncbi:OB-fold nucleic acid binding domain-containing protein [Thermoproteota archaeon]
MDEKFLLRTALVCSILGVIVLYVISGRMEIEETTINKITNGQSEGEVIVSGKVSRITDKENFMFIELEKDEMISVFVMKNDYIGLNKGDFVEVRGEVKEYEGKKEIVAEELRIV